MKTMKFHMMELILFATETYKVMDYSLRNHRIQSLNSIIMTLTYTVLLLLYIVYDNNNLIIIYKYKGLETAK